MNGPLHNGRYSPCKGCEDRYPACSGHCQKPEFIKWQKEQEIIRENRRNYKPPAWMSEMPFDKRRTK